MKLLIIHNKYQSTNIGGEDIVYKNELESLQEKLGKNNVFSYEVSNDDIVKIRLFFEIWFSWKHYREVKKIVEKKDIDIVHVHNFFPLLTPSIFKAAKDGGAKVIHTLHNYRFWCISGIFYVDGFGICEKCVQSRFSFAGVFNKCYRKSLIQSLVAQMAFWFYESTKLFDSIDYFFVLTNFQEEKLKSLAIDQNKIILKPNGLNLNMSFDIHKKKNCYIYVGRLEESKGIYELLNIWSQLDKRFILKIVGGGDIEVDLKEKFESDNVIFYGKCKRISTLDLISSSKYLIQPSKWYETFGLTIIEAMSFGVPVIGYDIGTRKDFIKDEINGFLSTDDTLKKTIEKSLNYCNYDALSKNAIETAKLYENEYIAQKQIKIYKKILEGTN